MYGALGLGDDTPSVVPEPTLSDMIGVRQVNDALSSSPKGWSQPADA